VGLDQRASPPPSGRQAQGGGEGASVLLLAPSEAPPPSLHRRDLALHRRDLSLPLWGLGPQHTGRRVAVLSRSRPRTTGTLRRRLSSNVHSIVPLRSGLGVYSHGR